MSQQIISSIPLVDDLLTDGLTYVGTLRSNKPHLPDVMKASHNREVHSSLFGFNDQMTLVSYVPKPNKYVVALPACIMMQVLQTTYTSRRLQCHQEWNEQPRSPIHYVHHQEKGEPLACCTVRELHRCWSCGCIHHMASQLSLVKSSEGQRRRRLFLLELAHGANHATSPATVPDTNCAGVDTFGNEDGTTNVQLLVSHRRLNRQCMLSRGEYVAFVLVKLTRKKQTIY